MKYEPGEIKVIAHYNDSQESTVSVTRKDIVFTAAAADSFTPSTDAHWMLLYLDSDSNASTGWEGFDLMARDGQLCRYEGQGSKVKGQEARWQTVCSVKRSVNGNVLTITIPRKRLALCADSFTFDFKWADTPPTRSTSSPSPPRATRLPIVASATVSIGSNNRILHDEQD